VATKLGAWSKPPPAGPGLKPPLILGSRSFKAIDADTAKKLVVIGLSSMQPFLRDTKQNI